MIPLPSSVSSDLVWSKIPRTRNYELNLNGEIVGTLLHPSFWSADFVAETQQGHWIFRKGGFLGAGAEILDLTLEQPIATFKPHWGIGGTLAFSDGQTFHLQCKGWWHPVWTVTTESGQVVLHLHTREKTVDLAPGVDVPEARQTLLTMFCWCRVLQAEEDAAAAVVFT